MGHTLSVNMYFIIHDFVCPFSIIDIPETTLFFCDIIDDISIYHSLVKLFVGGKTRLTSLVHFLNFFLITIGIFGSHAQNDR